MNKQKTFRTLFASVFLSLLTSNVHAQDIQIIKGDWAVDITIIALNKKIPQDSALCCCNTPACITILGYDKYFVYSAELVPVDDGKGGESLSFYKTDIHGEHTMLNWDVDQTGKIIGEENVPGFISNLKKPRVKRLLVTDQVIVVYALKKRFEWTFHIPNRTSANPEAFYFEVVVK